MEGEEQFDSNGVTTVRSIRPSLLSLLVEAGVAPEQELRAAAASGMGGGERLGEVVLRNGWLDEAGLGKLLAQQWRLPFVSDESAILDRHRADAIPRDHAEALACCLIDIESGAPCAAVAEPATTRLDSLRAELGPDASFAVVTPTTLRRLLAEQRGEVPQAPAIDGDVELDQLLASLAAATARLTTFRVHVAALTAVAEAREQELGRCQTRIGELEQALTAERERSGSLRAKLAAIVDELDT
jgi:Type II secretion system (T2SS), protein E, N-terminal domain